MPPTVYHGTVKAYNYTRKLMPLVCEHFAKSHGGTLFAMAYIIAETESTYIMIESTRWFDDIRVGPDLPFPWFKGQVGSLENRHEKALGI